MRTLILALCFFFGMAFQARTQDNNQHPYFPPPMLFKAWKPFPMGVRLDRTLYYHGARDLVINFTLQKILNSSGTTKKRWPAIALTFYFSLAVEIHQVRNGSYLGLGDLSATIIGITVSELLLHKLFP